MFYLAAKFAISAALIVAISELAKRSSLLAAVLASLPLVSVLAMVWLYLETDDTERIAHFATGVFWLVLPSLALFVSLPLLLRAGLNFPFALLIASGITVAAYFAMLAILRQLDISI